MLPSIFGESLFDDIMDDTFDEFDRSFFNWPAAVSGFGKSGRNLMKTDVKENDKDYEVDIDLPGFDKDDISAELKDGYLTISAKKDENNDKKDEKSGQFIRRERYSGSVSRSYYVGDDIKQEDIHAKYDNGILKLTVPKPADKQIEDTSHRIAIEG